MAYKGLSGEWLMYNDGSGDLYRVQKNGTGAVKIFGHNDSKEIVAATQRNGWIYFLTYDEPRIRLEKVRPDGSEYTVLNENLYEIGSLSTSPKDPSGTKYFPDPHVFLEGTPDGKWLLYRTPNGDMYRVHCKGTKKELLYGSSTGVYQIVHARCYEDWIYYVRDDVTNKENPYSDLFRMKIDGSKNELVRGSIATSFKKTLMIGQGSQTVYIRDGDSSSTYYYVADGTNLIQFGTTNVYEEYKYAGYIHPNATCLIMDKDIMYYVTRTANRWTLEKMDPSKESAGQVLMTSTITPTSYGRPFFLETMPQLALTSEPELTEETVDTVVTPVISEQIDQWVETIEGHGSYVKIFLTLAKPEICSQLVIRPFTKYPIELVSLQYEEDTETYHRPKELIQYAEEKESTNIIRVMFPAVVAKRFTIIINQKNYEKNTYLVQEKNLNNKDLWAKIAVREAEVTLDLGDGLETVEQSQIDTWTGWNIYLQALERYRDELKAWQKQVEEYNKQYAKYEEDLAAYYRVWTDYMVTLQSLGYYYYSVEDVIKDFGRS